MNDMSRRTFLKAGAALSGLFLAENALGGVRIEQWLDDGFVALRNGKFLQVKPTTCTQCPAGCGVIGFVDHGRMVSVQGNPKDPNSLGKICARGVAAVNRVSDNERVLWPLKRSGKRGEGKWDRISWDAALQEIALKLGPIRDAGEDSTLVFDDGDEMCSGIVREFLSAFGSPLYFNRSNMERASHMAACSGTLGEDSVVPDLSKTRYVLNFGANPYEHHQYYVPLLHRLVDNRVNNDLKMITFDVRLSNTAAKSDQWIVCSPGSDGLVAMSIAAEIVRNDLHDKHFVNKWLSCSEDQLRRLLGRFTPAAAEMISGVKREQVERLAREFAGKNPAVAISGNGVGQHENATEQEKAILLLNAITGNIDIPGGLCIPRRFHLPPAGSNTLEKSRTNVGKLFSELRDGKARVSAYVDYKANPAYSTADCKAVEQILKNEESVNFLLVMDTHISETGKLADIILPAASGMESWGLVSRASLNFIPQLNLVQPLVAPPGEAREIGAILIGLVQKMGGELSRRFPYSQAQDSIVSSLRHFPDLEQAGGLQRLRKEGVWLDSRARPKFREFEADKFKTPSGKYEVFSEDLLSGQRDLFTILRPPEKKQGAVVMATFRTGLRSSRNANCKWLTEITHENRLWIHPETAANFGLSEDDRAEVSSESGLVQVRVRITWGIRPGVVALAKGFGHETYGHVAESKRFTSKDPDTNLIWWNEFKSDVNTNILIPLSSDPSSGGQVSKSIQVRLKKC